MIAARTQPSAGKVAAADPVTRLRSSNWAAESQPGGALRRLLMIAES